MNTLPLSFGGIADAYLEWAQATQYRDFQPNALKGVLIKWKRNATLPLVVPSVYQHQRIGALTLPQADISALFQTSGPANACVERIELATAVAMLATAVAMGDSQFGPEMNQHYAPPDSSVLLGVIDHGCPFAALQSTDCTAHVSSKSRVWQLWDQNTASQGSALDGAAPHPPGTDFRYGGQWSSRALNHKINAAGDDDAQAYAFAGMTYMRPRITHGSHVLDVFAGPIPVEARISASRSVDGSCTDAPTWQAAADAASSAPIVFVQIPKEGLDDPSGRWLGRNVLDGLHYIAQCAGPKTERIVVNISWGPQTGPHDGTSLLEEAMVELVTAQNSIFVCRADGSTVKRDFNIVLPTGNSYAARAHAAFSASMGCKNLAWNVPPGNETPSFLEIWWPVNTAMEMANISVTAPDGSVFSIVNSSQGEICIHTTQSAGITLVPYNGNRPMTLLALAPTFAHNGAVTAMHGQWWITVAPIVNSTGEVHVYVARASTNMGSKVRAQNAYLDDPQYDPDGFVRTAETDSGLSVDQRRGTLNGIATGCTDGIWVAAGYEKARMQPSHYSSSGPSCGTRTGPDYALPTDESRALSGVLAGGVRTGSVFRLVGTSAAAPQLARHIANKGGVALPDRNGLCDSRIGYGLIP